MNESDNLQEQKDNGVLPCISKRLFLCDICGHEKSGKKFLVLDENWNKQIGLNQCEDGFNEGCGLD